MNHSPRPRSTTSSAPPSIRRASPLSVPLRGFARSLGQSPDALNALNDKVRGLRNDIYSAIGGWGQERPSRKSTSNRGAMRRQTVGIVPPSMTYSAP